MSRPPHPPRLYNSNYEVNKLSVLIGSVSIQKRKKSLVSVLKRTIPTERPPLVGKFFPLYGNPGQPTTLLQLKLVGILAINLFLT
jgi:hypothetical protein